MKDEQLKPVDLGEVKMSIIAPEQKPEQKPSKPGPKPGTKQRKKASSKTEEKNEDLDEPFDLFVHPLVKSAKVPMASTEDSACFDLRVCFEGFDEIIGYDDFNKKISTTVRRNPDKEAQIILRPNTRVKLPTQLMFDIPKNKKLIIYSRSGRSFEEGLVLINAPAIIDSDYSGVDQIWLLVKNTAAARVVIKDGDRLAQAELQDANSKETLRIRRLQSRPEKKGNREGGVGSTGK